MAWKSEKNKNIIVDFVKHPNLVLTLVIDAALVELDPFFEGCKTYATSGLRDAYSQLRIIRNFLKQQNISNLYPKVMDVNLKPQEMEYDGVLKENIYVWQWAWSHLLNKKIIINPPLAAICLMDYFGIDGKGPNKKGQLIPQTNHANGLAVNLGGGGNGIDDELACMKKAQAAKVKCLATHGEPVVAERGQNALHLNLRKF